MNTQNEQIQEKPKKETKYSYSRLGCLKDCGFKYKLKYIDKHFVYSGSIATEFGSAMHRAEESVANYIKDNLQINYNVIKNRFIVECEKIKYKYKNDWFVADEYSKKNYEQKFYDYLEYGVYRLENFMNNHPEFIIEGAEVPIDFKYGDKYRFTGSIDRLLYNKLENKYIIQDVKSWPCIAKYEDELTTPLQFVVYSLALAQMKGIDVENVSCQYDLPISGELADAGTKGYIDRGQKKLDSLFEKIETNEYVPAPGRFCHWCEFCRTNTNAPFETRWLCPYASSWTQERQLNITEFDFESLENYLIDLNAYKTKHGIPIDEPESIADNK